MQRANSFLLTAMALGVIVTMLVRGGLAAGALSDSPPPAAKPGKPLAKPEPYRSVDALALQRQRDAKRGFHYETLARGNPRLRVVALTFDDGPHPQYTPQLLAILRQSNVKATFFVVGEMAQQYPDLVRLERAQGHIVGDHTYHHLNLTKIPNAQVTDEWKLCQDTVERIIKQPVQFCRPPGGDYDRQVIRAASDLGLTTVLWTDDPGDYASPGKKAIDVRVLDRIGNGGIILLHNGIQQTMDVLPELIKQLRDRGFRFVTVSELQAGLGGRQAAAGVG